MIVLTIKRLNWIHYSIWYHKIVNKQAVKLRSPTMVSSSKLFYSHLESWVPCSMLHQLTRDCVRALTSLIINNREIEWYAFINIRWPGMPGSNPLRCNSVPSDRGVRRKGGANAPLERTCTDTCRLRSPLSHRHGILDSLSILR